MRRAISRRMKNDHGLAYDPADEILITTGATMGVYVAVLSVVDPGDEVLIFDPVYDPYPTVVRMAGGVPVRLEAVERDGHFSVSSRSLRRALTQRTSAIIINNPWNPTGTVMTLDELMGLAELAEEHDLVLISDEIYEKVTYDDRVHVPLASVSPEARDRTITLNSFSKTYAMTGWRLGYNLAPPSLTEAMLAISSQMSRSAATFIQAAGVAALDGSQQEVGKMVTDYQSRRRLVSESFRDAGLTGFSPPEGTFFAFVDVRPYGMSSDEMTEHLMQTAGVVTLPGSAYGSAGEGFIRLSFAYSEETVREGITRIATALARLTE